MQPKIYKIIITTPNFYFQVGSQHKVAPTPYYHKATNPNGRHGVWILGDKNEVVFVPFWQFLVVEYKCIPNPIGYGYVSSVTHPSGRVYWSSEAGRMLFLRIKKEYLDLGIE